MLPCERCRQDPHWEWRPSQQHACHIHLPLVEPETQQAMVQQGQLAASHAEQAQFEKETLDREIPASSVPSTQKNKLSGVLCEETSPRTTLSDYGKMTRKEGRDGGA